tara:strand:- start:451 stop:696 length:246 start_codon:yes stop_codon:yes gene_type:complete
MGYKPVSRAVYVCTKLSDDNFEGNHPNGVVEGCTTRGFLYRTPEVGQRAIIGSLRTSIVTEIVDETTFKTENSTYKLENAD